jgi:hypothetical protein
LNTGRLYRGAGSRAATAKRGPVRAVFVLYLTLVVTAIGCFAVIGLTHH